MKKLAALAFSLLMGCALFAQVSASKFFVGVYKFATEPSKDWEILDTDFRKADVLAQEYEFSGAFIVKMFGYTRYDFTCRVVNEGSDFSVNLSNVSSTVSDKNGKKKGSAASTPASVSSQYAKQMKDEITARIGSLSDSDCKDFIISYIENSDFRLGNSKGAFISFLKDADLINDSRVIKNTRILSLIAKDSADGEFVKYLTETKVIQDKEFITSKTMMTLIADNLAKGEFGNFLINNKFTEDEAVLCNTGILALVGKNSNNKLQFERYLTKTGLVGKKVTMPIVFSSVDKNIFGTGKKKYMVIAEATSCMLSYFTNNEDFIDLSSGASTEITGIIDSIKFDENVRIITMDIIEG